jgi:SAM-dependent methyltransferase
MNPFDRQSVDYSRRIEDALSIAGLPHDFFLDAKVEHLLAVGGLVAGGGPLRLLEIGSGIGLLQRRLRQRVARVWGLDPSISSLRLDTGASGRLVGAHGAHLPFADGRFDLVIAVCVLHHVPIDQRPTVLAEMARVTRPGGVVSLGEHNPWNPLTRLVVARCELDHDAILLTAAEAGRRLRAAGLATMRARYILFFPWRGALWRWLERRLTALPLGAQYFVHAVRH